uniref:Retrovirus-related Pol polyprotein from transposon TNT 1-94 n=1 Tax=Tanacetum cinerariifolium TaxID=118510 RepID=A0A6L2LYA3_TANCI|nr:retrovirus-related Pol polyprotein from transposon TNT 1-94 [Tanacetum cinerariifolium]
MDSGASFHATYCKEELERFKLRFGKVRLADNKTLDIASVGDVVLKTSFWYKLDSEGCMYIPGLKRRLISVGQLDEEGYHVGFGDQQWKVTKGSLVVASRNKHGSLYMVEVHLKGLDVRNVDIYFCKPSGLGKQNKLFFIMQRRQGNCRGWSRFIQKAMTLHLLHRSKYLATMILLLRNAAAVANGIVMLKMVPKTPLQFGVAERLSRTFRVESTGLRVKAPKMLWANPVSTTYLIYHIPYFSIGLRIPEEE